MARQIVREVTVTTRHQPQARVLIGGAPETACRRAGVDRPGARAGRRRAGHGRDPRVARRARAPARRSPRTGRARWAPGRVARWERGRDAREDQAAAPEQVEVVGVLALAYDKRSVRPPNEGAASYRPLARRMRRSSITSSGNSRPREPAARGRSRTRGRKRGVRRRCARGFHAGRRNHRPADGRDRRHGLRRHRSGRRSPSGPRRNPRAAGHSAAGQVAIWPAPAAAHSLAASPT
jgi:hypothetical protein